MALIGLTLNNRSVKTLLPDGTVYKTWTDSEIANSKNRIGEKKVFEASFTSDTDLSGMNIFINPALFLPIGYVNTITGAGNFFWSYPLPDSAAIGTYPCNYQGTGFNEGKNYYVEVEVVSVMAPFQFKVRVYFFQIYDVNTYLNPSSMDESNALLKDRLSNPSQLTVSGSSIYTDVNTDGRMYVYIEKRTDASVKGSMEIKFGDYKAGFYAKDEHQAAPYFSGPVWALTGIVNGKLNTAASTKVVFSITSPVIVSKVVMWIIRTDAHFPLGVNFYDYYEADWNEIMDPGGSNGPKIIGPMSAPEKQGASTTWNSEFYIDPALIVGGAKYRFIAVVYQDDLAYTDLEVNSFISDEILVNTSVPYTGGGLDFTGFLYDYNREFTGNSLSCVIEERMRSKLQIDFAADKWKNDILDRLGLTVPNDIRKYLTQITFQIYDQVVDINLGVIRNIYDERIAYRVNQTTYTGNNGLSLTFGTDTANFKADWRNRYEANTQAIRTEINGILWSSILSNQYWGGTIKKIDWILLFVYDDYAYPFSDTMTFTQALTVADYVGGVGAPLSIEAQTEADEEKDFWCPGDEFCLQASLTEENPSDYSLITNIEPDPGSIYTIEEAEAWAGAQLVQLTSPKIISQEILYSSTSLQKAKWCIDTDELELDTTYKVSALAKKTVFGPG